MKLGKRRWEAKHEAKSARADATPSPEPGPASPSVVGYEPPAGAAPASEADDGADTVLEGEAVELPADADAETPPPAAATSRTTSATAYVPPAPAAESQLGHSQSPPPMPFPVADEPVAVVTPGPETDGVTPLAEAAPFYASGHAHGTAPSWPEPVLALAAERPEVVVGAAFAGGILFAAILRRLGN